MLKEINIKDFKQYYKQGKGIAINNINIYFTTQKTGYGQKIFFSCPSCSSRKTKLYIDDDLNIKCRSCIDVNIYKARTNLYDEGGTDILEYKMIKIFRKLKTEKTQNLFPFDYRIFLLDRPKYMRYEKFILLLKQLTVLSAMRDKSIIFRCSYSTKYIQSILRSSWLKNIEINKIFHYIWNDLV